MFRITLHKSVVAEFIEKERKARNLINMQWLHDKRLSVLNSSINSARVTNCAVCAVGSLFINCAPGGMKAQSLFQDLSVNLGVYSTPLQRLSRVFELNGLDAINNRAERAIDYVQSSDFPEYITITMSEVKTLPRKYAGKIFITEVAQ